MMRELRELGSFMGTIVLLAPLILGCAADKASDSDELPRRAQSGSQSTTIDESGYPQPDEGYVTDIAELLAHQEEEQIEGRLAETVSESGVVIVVVTIEALERYPGADNSTIEAFATGLFNDWAVGRQPENDGVLLLISRDDRKVRIELGEGYPGERDADAKRVLDESILPHLRQGEFSTGIAMGVQGIAREFVEQRGP